MPQTDSLKSEEFRDRLGEFIDEYIRFDDGKTIPRNIPYFKMALEKMLEPGMFRSVEELKRTALKDYLVIIPDFLLEDIS